MTLRIRGGGGVPAPPQPPAVYGPTDGAASVRSAAGARAVSNPGGGISFNSSGSLQSAINANATGSTFVCSVNNPTWNSTVNTGTKQPTIIFPGAVGQANIDLFHNTIPFITCGDNTVIRGGTWKQSDYGFAAILMANNCTLQDVVMTANFDKGTSMAGLNNTVSHCTFHSNGNQGLSTGAGGQQQAGNNALVEYTEIYNNNTRLLQAGVQGGAHKFNYSGHSWYHHNYVHDNIGFGSWWDTGCFDWLIEENVLENNYFANLMYEANWGSTIRHNLIQNAGRNTAIGGEPASVDNQVNVRFSDDPADQPADDGIVYKLDFHLNVVDHTATLGGNSGRLIQLWDHTDSISRHCGNHEIHHNQFWLRPGIAGVSFIRNRDQDVIDTITTNWQLWNLNNIYHDNEYRVADLSTAYWMWDTGTGFGTSKTFAQWQTFHPTGETRVLI